ELLAQAGGVPLSGGFGLAGGLQQFNRAQDFFFQGLEISSGGGKDCFNCVRCHDEDWTSEKFGCCERSISQNFPRGCEQLHDSGTRTMNDIRVENCPRRQGHPNQKPSGDGGLSARG